MFKHLVAYASLGLFATLMACQVKVTPSPTASPSAGVDLKWFSTCGDPVCGRPNATPVVNTCGNFKEGQSCIQEGASCDLGNDCHQKLICAKSDPKLQPGGCPISKAIWKQDIHFLGPAERAQQALRLEKLKLASWHYRFEPQGPLRLGFLIDQATPANLVKPDGNSVDLYGYVSMSVAAVQDQQARVKNLEARMARLESELSRCSKSHK